MTFSSMVRAGCKDKEQALNNLVLIILRVASGHFLKKNFIIYFFCDCAGLILSFPADTVAKNLSANAGDPEIRDRA